MLEFFAKDPNFVNTWVYAELTPVSDRHTALLSGLNTTVFPVNLDQWIYHVAALNPKKRY